MSKNNCKPVLKESSDVLDLIRMQTGVGLIDSVSGSRALTAMVILGIILFSAFCYFLYKMAGA